tara:strand:- start:50 stop:451 length:402 start_codon:yes stop_codon:yes gene_type:complete
MTVVPITPGGRGHLILPAVGLTTVTVTPATAVSPTLADIARSTLTRVLGPAPTLLVLSTVGLASPTTIPVITAVAVTPINPRSGTGRTNPGPQAGLGLPQAEYRARRLRQNLDLQIVLGHAQTIQGPFLRFIE